MEMAEDGTDGQELDPEAILNGNLEFGTEDTSDFGRITILSIRHPSIFLGRNEL